MDPRRRAGQGGHGWPRRSLGQFRSGVVDDLAKGVAEDAVDGAANYASGARHGVSLAGRSDLREGTEHTVNHRRARHELHVRPLPQVDEPNRAESKSPPEADGIALPAHEPFLMKP